MSLFRRSPLLFVVGLLIGVGVTLFFQHINKEYEKNDTQTNIKLKTKRFNLLETNNTFDYYQNSQNLLRFDHEHSKI